MQPAQQAHSNQEPRRIYCLHLSSNGDSVEIDQKGNPEIPEMQEAAKCKTHEEVLAFLKNIDKSPKFKDFKLYHISTRYVVNCEHYNEKYMHECPLEAQIKFVGEQIAKKSETWGAYAKSWVTLK